MKGQRVWRVEYEGQSLILNGEQYQRLTQLAQTNTIGADRMARALLKTQEEADRNARAFGWEIGHGQELGKVIESSPDNPFLDPNWRRKVPKP